MMAFAAAVVAGPEVYGRLAAAFDWRGGDAALAVAGSRVDAWIDPPPYAGRPPVVIDVASGAPQTLTAFEDSVLVVRGEPGVVETKVEGAVEPVKDATKPRREGACRAALDDSRRRQGRRSGAPGARRPTSRSP